RRGFSCRTRPECVATTSSGTPKTAGYGASTAIAQRQGCPPAQRSPALGNGTDTQTLGPPTSISRPPERRQPNEAGDGHSTIGGKARTRSGLAIRPQLRVSKGTPA